MAYFDVSHNIKILHLNDSNEFENEVNKKLEKKIETIEPTFETINLCNDENSRLIKIGSTLMKKKERISKSFSQNFKKCLHGPIKLCLVSIPR